MRVNKFVALATGLGRRYADEMIAKGRVTVNNRLANVGQIIKPDDEVLIDGSAITLKSKLVVALNKPVGYVVSRDGQGAPTIYELLPAKYHYLKPVGRLDKDSSGLMLLTNNGQLAQELTHPSFEKQKIYEVRLNKPLSDDAKQKLEEGVMLEDGSSSLLLTKLTGNNEWQVAMSEGRNRQIRRTFAALDYKVTHLHRIQFGNYKLGSLKSGKTEVI